MTIHPHPQRPPVPRPPPRRPHRRQRPPPQRGHRRRLLLLSGFTQVSDLLATRPGKVRILIGRTHRPTLEQIAAGLSAGDTLALLANGGVRQGCRVDAGLAVLQDGYCRQCRFAPTQQSTGASPASEAPACLALPHPLIPAAPAPPPRRTAESTAAPVPPAPCPPNSAP